MRAFVLVCSALFVWCASGVPIDLPLAIFETDALSDSSDAPIRAKRAALDANETNVELGVAAHANRMLLSQIAIGTPPQPINIKIVLNRPFLWVPAYGCNSSHNNSSIDPSQQREFSFDTDLSVTFNSTSDKFKTTAAYNYTGPSRSRFSQYWPFGHRQPEPGEVSGDIGEDVVRLGGANGPLMPRALRFGLAQEINYVEYGVLGLAPLDRKQNRQPWLSNPVLEAIGQRIFDEPYFSVYLRECVDRQCQLDGGSLRLGGVDAERCAPADIWLDAGRDGGWRIQVESVSLGGLSISSGEPFNQYVFREEKTKVSAALSLDNGEIEMPSDVIEAVVELTDAKLRDGRYHVHCDNEFRLEFRVTDLNGEEHDLIVPPRHLLRREKHHCSLAVRANKEWTLGLPFGRSYCQVFDALYARVGFGTPNDFAPHLDSSVQLRI